MSVQLPIVDTTPVACCTPLGEAPLSRAQAQDLSTQLKALADPARLQLVSLLLAAPGGEACTCDLTVPLGLSQPTVSHHLKKLSDAGIVAGERRGVWTFYRARPQVLADIAAALAPAQP